MAGDLTAYVPRLLLEWEETQPDVRYRAIDGTLVFADVSGFTKLSERLARAGGKIGAEQMTDVINRLFGDLLLVAAARGGEMLKYGGDAVLLFFSGDEHPARGVAACVEMQRKLKEIGRVETGAGIVRLRMSVGVNSGTFDFFKVGRSHEELIVAGPATTVCVEMEAAADATEILVSPSTAAMLDAGVLGPPKSGGRLVRRLPKAPFVDFVPLVTDVDVTKFLPGAVRASLGDGGADSDHRLGTIAFLHLMGLDNRLRSSDGTDVADALHRSLCVVQDTFVDHGVSFLATDLAPDGTKVMAAAGAPRAVEDAEGRMLQALHEIVCGATPLAIRAGVHRGHVFAGDVGPPFRRTYTTIGDVTNTAARVMGRALPGQVLALRDVLDAADVVWHTSEQEPFFAKGKREALVPFVVERPLGRRRSDNTQLPLIGREREVAKIVSLLGGDGGSLEVVAEAGLGKSRLVEEAMRRSTLERALTLAVDPLDRTRPFRTLRRLVELMAEQTDPVSLAKWLTNALSTQEHARPMIALLGTILELPLGDEADLAKLEERGRRRLLDDVVGAVLDFGLGHRTLVIDDAHDVDASSAEVLAPVLARTGGAVVVTRRPSDSGLRIQGSEVLELAPLTAEETRTLAETALRGIRLPEHIARFAERAQGSPLYLSALLSTGGDHETTIPESVEAAIAARIDTLAGPARRALRRLSVAGMSYASAKLPVLDLPVDLGGGQLAEFLTDDDDGAVRFRHALVRDVAYESLPYRERRESHLALARDEAAAVNPAPDLLAHHYFHAGAWEDAARFGRIAGDVARSKWANREAAAFYSTAVAAHRRFGSRPDAELWENLGFASLQSADFTMASKAFAAARRVAGPSGDPVASGRLAFWSGQALERRGDRTGALRWYRRGLCVPMITSEGAKWRVRNLISVAIAENLRGRGDRTIALAEEAAELAKEHGDDPGLAHAAMVLFVEYMGRRDDRRHQYRDIPLRIYEAANDPLGVCNVLINTGYDDFQSGMWTEAAGRYEAARKTASKCGAVRIEAIAATNLGELRLDQGRLDEAAALFDEAKAMFEPLGDRVGAATCMADLGRVASRRRDETTAVRCLRAAATAFREVGASPSAFAAEVWEAMHHCLAGDPERGHSEVERLLEDRRAVAAEASLLPQAHRAVAVALARLRREGAQAAINRSIELASREGAVYETAISLATARYFDLDAGAGIDDPNAVFHSLGVVSLPPPLDLDRRP